MSIVIYIVTTDSNIMTEALAKDFGIVAYNENQNAYNFLKKLLTRNKNIVYFSKSKEKYDEFSTAAKSLMDEHKDSEIYIVDADGQAANLAKKASIFRCYGLTAQECVQRLD